jgi:3-hydroxyisobutyrate dehydrogenase
MVGGKPEVYDRCREILQSFGDGIFYVGEHGTGHLVKALNNLLSATSLASAAEATLVAQKGGLRRTSSWRSSTRAMGGATPPR